MSDRGCGGEQSRGVVLAEGERKKSRSAAKLEQDFDDRRGIAGR
jgi:hypothetical protein